MLPQKRIPTHPGAILQEDFLEPMGLTQVPLASQLNISVQRINELIVGKRGVRTQIAWLLSQAFETTPEFWLTLQIRYDLAIHKPTRKLRAIKAN